VGEVPRLQSGGGPAAEVDRVDSGKGGGVSLPEIDLREEVIDEADPALPPAGENREVAVGADGGTEGDVEVEAGTGRRCFQILSFQ
jgi:hypothetical protein